MHPIPRRLPRDAFTLCENGDIGGFSARGIERIFDVFAGHGFCPRRSSTPEWGVVEIKGW